MPTPITGQGITAPMKADATLSHTSKNAVQNKAVTNALAGAYDATATYAVGDLCIYDGILYECTTEIATAEAWNAAHWETGNFGEKVAELNRQLSDVQKNTIYSVTLDTLNEIQTFYVNAGDTVVISASDEGVMTVGQIRFVRQNGTNDYWTIQSYTERRITMSESFVGVYITGGTLESIIVTNESSPANYHTETDQLRKDLDSSESLISSVANAVGITNPEFAVVDGYFITTSGSKTASAPFVYSNPIAVNKGTVVSLVGAGYNTNVAMISTCTQDGSNIRPRAICTDSNVKTYEYTADADGYIIVCYNKTVDYGLTLDYDRIGFIDEKINVAITAANVTPSALNTGFIHRDGRIVEGSNFRYTNPIRLENEVIEFTATGYSNVISLLSLCDEDGGNRINVINSTDDEPTKNISYTSNGVSFVIICSNVSTPISYTTTKLNIGFDDPYVSLSMFQKFGVVGDSYASGALFFNDQEKDDYAHSWGQILARKLGTTCTNYSKGGLSTRTWLTDSKGLALVLSSDAEEIYYLALGINDSYSLGASYLGSITDITSHSAYADYPDTFFGNYGKIIEQIQNHAPYGKLVMFTIAGINEDAVRDSYNEAIIEIADHYNIPYIVQNNDQFFMSSFYNATKIEGHPIAITYSGMAEAFERLLIDCIRNNVGYFENTFWYN